MKSLKQKFVAGLAMIASVTFMAGCGNSNSSSNNGGAVGGVYSAAFGTSVVCSAGMSPYMMTVVDQTVYGLQMNWQIYTDASYSQIMAACGVMTVQQPVYAGACTIAPGQYNLGMLTTSTVVPNVIQNSQAGTVMGLNFQAVGAQASYSMALQSYLTLRGGTIVMQGGQMVTLQIAQPGLGAVSCADSQGEAL